MNSFLFFLSFILLNPRVLCFLSQFLIPGKVGGSGFFSISCGFCKIKDKLPYRNLSSLTADFNFITASGKADSFVICPSASLFKGKAPFTKIRTSVFLL